jgi:ketosteroid isomerase-like protein
MAEPVPPVSSSPADPTDARLALADRFFDAIERGDLATVRDCYTADATIWHNHDEVDQALAEHLAVLAWMAGNLRDLRYGDRRRIVHDGGVVHQHVLTATLPDGRRFRLLAMLRLDMVDDDGVLRIARLEEYLDTAQLAVLRTAR